MEDGEEDETVKKKTTDWGDLLFDAGPVLERRTDCPCFVVVVQAKHDCDERVESDEDHHMKEDSFPREEQKTRKKKRKRKKTSAAVAPPPSPLLEGA